MRKHTLALAVVLASTIAAPAFAADSMMSSNSMMSANHGMMMKKGETMLVMPNGQTMTMMSQGGAGEMAMMKDAKPLDKCTILMMGKDGKMYMGEDMKMSNGKMLCDDMAMMKH